MTEHTGACIRCGVLYDKCFLPEVVAEEWLCDTCYDNDPCTLVKLRPAASLLEALDKLLEALDKSKEALNKIVRDAFNGRR